MIDLIDKNNIAFMGDIKYNMLSILIMGNFVNYRKSVFKTRERVVFDPSNKEHMKDYAQFIRRSNWKNGCNYLLEDPFYDIPTMINDKIVRHVLEAY